VADPQDPLPESSWFWRRLLIFAGVISCAIGIAIILGMLHIIATKGLASPDTVNGAQIALHSIEALYNLGFWLVILVLVNLTLYLIAPSAEQATKMLATVSALKAGVSFTSRAAIDTGTGRAESSSVAGPASPAPAPAAPAAEPPLAPPSAPAAASEPAERPTGAVEAPPAAEPARVAAAPPPPPPPPAAAAPIGELPKPISFISADLLAVACPGTPKAELLRWVEPIQKACARFEINNVRRVAAFIAQMAHESAGFTRLEENLNYTAKRLTQVWPGRFPTIDAAAPYARNPEKLANKVYGGRMGNGPESSGDGWRFRGGGPLQVTGAENWKRFSKALGMKLEQALAYGRTREGGVMAAAWFWESNDINRLADTPGVADESKRINGGTNGLADRKAKFDALVAKLLRLEKAAA
jgi:putative chitinase